MPQRALRWMWVILALIAPQLRADTPKQPFTAFTVPTDNIPRANIAGWYLPASEAPKGTIFMAHGFRNSKQLMVPYQWLRDDLNWNLVMFDFRNHGESSRTGLPTVGYFEQWDLKAIIDWAEANHLAKPYVCIGVSMGASISLRWAGQDPRISGVIAYSPYKTGWDAVNEFHFRGHSMRPLPSLLMHGGFKRMLQDVDIPKAVSQRDDLRIWIVVGEQDWFPAKDQEAILAASPSPPRLKRLEVIPGAGHAQQYKWRGNDRMIKQFLAETNGVNIGAALDDSKRNLLLAAASTGAAAIIFTGLRRRLRRSPVSG